jgi:hypothetical protein
MIIKPDSLFATELDILLAHYRHLIYLDSLQALCYRDAAISFGRVSSTHEAPAGLALLGDTPATAPETWQIFSDPALSGNTRRRK